MGVIETVPSVVFKTRVRDESVPGPNPYRWQDLTTEEIFKGKKVVVFSLPGALLQLVRLIIYLATKNYTMSLKHQE